MCYGSNCGWENCNGECRKPASQPCPLDESDVRAYEEAEDLRYQLYEEEQWAREREAENA